MRRSLSSSSLTRLWPGSISRRRSHRQEIGDTELTPKSIKEIVGVVEDVKDGSLDSEIWPAVYYPFNQDGDTDFSLVARSRRPSNRCFQRWSPPSVRSIPALAR